MIGGTDFEAGGWTGGLAGPGRFTPEVSAQRLSQGSLHALLLLSSPSWWDTEPREEPAQSVPPENSQQRRTIVVLVGHSRSPHEF